MTIYSTYQQLALRTEKQLPTKNDRLEHALLGLITEVGEVATEVKRVAIYEKSLDDVNKAGVTLRQHLAEEIGDICWYMAIAADATGIDLFGDNLSAMCAGGQWDESTLKHMVFALAHANGALIHNYTMFPSVVPAILISQAHVLVDLVAVLGLDFEQILEANIAKLRERFPAAYSNEAAEARADKGGLEAKVS